MLKHEPVSFLQAFDGQRKSAELIFTVRVRASNIKNQIRRHFPEGIQKSFFQSVEIFVIARTILEANILIGRGLRHRIVVFLVDGKRENARIVSKDRSRAIAVMHVGVNGHGRANLPCRLEGPNRDANVVDHAKPFSMARIGMVEASAQVGSKAVLESLATSED